MCARKSKKKITQRMFSMPEINHPNVVQDEIVNAKMNVLIARLGLMLFETLFTRADFMKKFMLADRATNVRTK